MRTITKLLAGAAISLSALALPATAFAATTGAPLGQQHTYQPPKGDKGGNNNQDPNGKGNDNNRGDPKGCSQDNNLKGDFQQGGKGDFQPWSQQCKPAPKPPVCKDTWGWQTSYTRDNHTGDLRRHLTWGQTSNCDPRPVVCENNWSWNTSWNQGHEFETWGENWGQQNCDHHQSPPVRCNTCKTVPVTFQFSTYGDWLKELYGPALYDGEHLTYQGRTYTVEAYTTHGKGSQGPGTYFVLKLNGTSLESPGTPNDPAHNVNGVARTICQHQHFGDQGNYWLTA